MTGHGTAHPPEPGPGGPGEERSSPAPARAGGGPGDRASGALGAATGRPAAGDGYPPTGALPMTAGQVTAAADERSVSDGGRSGSGGGRWVSDGGRSAPDGERQAERVLPAERVVAERVSSAKSVLAAESVLAGEGVPATKNVLPAKSVLPQADDGDRRVWSRDFALFFTARALAKLGETMLPVALAAGLLEHGYGAGAVGLAMASSVACFAGLVIFGGVFADRFGTRGLMIGADLVRLVSQSLAAVFFFTGHVVLWQICAIGAVNGAANAVFQPGVASTVPRLAADVQAANGAIRIAESTAQLAGPALAGLLVAFASPGGVFAAHAATYALSALCLLLLRLPPKAEGTAGRTTGFLADLVEGWQEFRSRTWLWGVIAIWCVLMIGASGPTVPLVATQVVQEHGPRAYGLVNSALGAGTVIGGLAALRARPRRMLRAGAVALYLFAFFPAVVGAQFGVGAMAAGAAVAGAGQSFWAVMWATSVQTQVSPGVLNRIHAYDVAGSLAMMPVGQALAGPAAGLFGTEHVLLAGSVVTLFVATALLAVPAIRNLVRVDSAVSRYGPGRAAAPEQRLSGVTASTPGHAGQGEA